MGHIAQFRVLIPQSVTIYKTGDDSQIHVNILQFQNFTQGMSKGMFCNRKFLLQFSKL